jgi:hypothetical protein
VWAARGTKTYEDNFDYAFSFYQPMIEYLDRKLSGLDVSGEELPHLRYSDERGVEQVRKYNLKDRSRSDLSGGSERRVVRSQTERDLKEAILLTSAEEKEDESKGKEERMMRVAKQYGYSRDAQNPSSSSTTKSLLLRHEGETSRVKLGVSKSTSSSSLLVPTPNSNNDSIRKPLYAKSFTVKDLQDYGYNAQCKEMIQTRKMMASRRTDNEFDAAKNTALSQSSAFTASSSFSPSRTSTFFLEKDKDEQTTNSRLQKSRSFGAFTDKAKRDTEDALRMDTLHQVASKYKRAFTSVLGRSGLSEVPSFQKRNVHFSQSSFVEPLEPSSLTVVDVLKIKPSFYEAKNDDAVYWQNMW